MPQGHHAHSDHPLGGGLLAMDCLTEHALISCLACLQFQSRTFGYEPCSASARSVTSGCTRRCWLATKRSSLALLTCSQAACDHPKAAEQLLLRLHVLKGAALACIKLPVTTSCCLWTAGKDEVGGGSAPQLYALLLLLLVQPPLL